MMRRLLQRLRGGYFKCPVCGYWAYDGERCWDCGYGTRYPR